MMDDGADDEMMESLLQEKMDNRDQAKKDEA